MEIDNMWFSKIYNHGFFKPTLIHKQVCKKYLRTGFDI
jgi:hypothetical protein